MDSKACLLGEEVSDYLSRLNRQRYLGLAADNSSLQSVQSVCVDALQRARAYERLQGSPFDAALIASLAVQIADSYSCIHPELLMTIIQGNQILSALRILCEVRIKWGMQCSLSEYEERGIQGLVGGYLEECNDSDLETTIGSKIRPVVSTSGQNLDAILLGLIQKTVASTLFTEEEDPASSQAFRRLIFISKAIPTVQTRAEAVLLLMQLPMIGSHEDHLKALQILHDVASELQEFSDTHTKEAIMESLRLFKLQSVASKYGVSKFDIRSRQQVKAVAFLIAGRTNELTSLDDALLFAQSYISPASLYSRAILSRAIEVSVSTDLRNESIRAVLQRMEQSPHYAMVLENCVDVLLVTISDCVKSMDPMNLPNESIACIEAATESAVFCVTQFLDAKNQRYPVESRSQNTQVSAELLTSLKSMQILQREHGVYLSLEQMRSESTRRSICSMLAGKVCEAILKDSDAESQMNMQNPLSPSIRRLCFVLQVLPSSFLYFIIKKVLSTESPYSSNISLHVASLLCAELRLLENVSELDSSCVAETTRWLCASSSKCSEDTNFGAFSISREILRNFLEYCSLSDLGRILDLFSAAELFLAVSERLDRVLSESTVKSDSFKIFDTAYTKDGLLLQFECILRPLRIYSLLEIERRSQTFDEKSDSDTDLVDLINLLQDAEHHIISIRILLGSWSFSPTKHRLLRNSMLSLSRKVLSYREIDVLLALACLSSLPQDLVVRELKAIFPTLQNDQTRLNCAASIGEDLARMWGSEEMLVLFETMQKNTRWINMMRTFNMKVDSRVMLSTVGHKNDAYLRALVPELLLKSGMDLDLIVDFCTQYNIESDFATLCYIEQSLVLPSDVHTWRTSLKQVAAGVDEAAVVCLLRRSLVKIHPLDYEKIEFVCTWLIDALTEDTIHMKANSSNGTVLGISDAEISTYTKYIEIISVLQTINTPKALIFSDNSPSSFIDGIPLWPLLEDPFGVMERLITRFPEVTGKLIKICSILQLDEDRFHVLKCKTIYDTERHKMHHTNDTDFDKNYAFMWGHIKVIKSRLQLAEFLKWIFEKEMKDHSSWAMFVLEKSIAFLKNNDLTEEEADLRQDNIAALLRCKCENSLQKLEASLSFCYAHDSALFLTLRSALDDPVSLPRTILRKSQSVLWNLQLLDMDREKNTVLSHADLYHSRFTASVLKGARTIATSLSEIVNHLKELEFSGTNFDLEKERKQVLAEYAIRKKETNGGNDLIDFNSLASESELTASFSEIRRNTEMHAAFCVASLILMCEEAELRESYIRHLLEVVKASSIKHTNHARYRAAQALCFLNENGTRDVSLSVLRDFYFCLSEAEEVRIPFNRDTIYASITGRHSILPVIFTWLHDDGYHMEVSELCRDMLLVCNHVELATWQRLLTSMLKHGHRKALWHTLTILSAKKFFTALIVDSYLGEALKLIQCVLSEVTQRIQNYSFAGDTPIVPEESDCFHLIPVFSSSKSIFDSKVSLPDVTLALKRLKRIWTNLDHPPSDFAEVIDNARQNLRNLIEIYFNMYSRSSTTENSDLTDGTIRELMLDTMSTVTGQSTKEHVAFLSNIFLSLCRIKQSSSDGYFFFEIIRGICEAFPQEDVHFALSSMESNTYFFHSICQCLSSAWHDFQYRYAAKTLLSWIAKW